MSLLEAAFSLRSLTIAFETHLSIYVVIYNFNVGSKRSCWRVGLSFDLVKHHQLEPRHRYIDNEDRPDIAFYDADFNRHNQRIRYFNGSPLEQGGYIAAKECGYATAKQEAIKTNKYSKETLPDGSKPTVLPLVSEHFGQ